MIHFERSQCFNVADKVLAKSKGLLGQRTKELIEGNHKATDAFYATLRHRGQLISLYDRPSPDTPTCVPHESMIPLANEVLEFKKRIETDRMAIFNFLIGALTYADSAQEFRDMLPDLLVLESWPTLEESTPRRHPQEATLAPHRALINQAKRCEDAINYHRGLSFLI